MPPAPAHKTKTDHFKIFLATAPGLEAVLWEEVKSLRFRAAKQVAGGVTVNGNWRDAWRANLEVRGANKVLARVGAFRVFQLTELDKLARRVPWGSVLRADVPFRVEVTCKKSKIYHSGAAAQRIQKAISERLGAPAADEADVTVMARIENDLCTISVDTSGELLHKRGFKVAVAKAPMRETMAALFLRQCGYVGTEPVVDPMCGSGTFVIEAAEIAAGLKPGRERHFAFEQLATFDAAAWEEMRRAAPEVKPAFRFYGSDRDAGAIEMSRANAARAGVGDLVDFHQHAISDLVLPPGPPGLVIANAPYGDRIGNKKRLEALYRAFGETLRTRFSGWRIGLVTDASWLAKATGLPFLPTTAPVAHGGIRVTLFRTEALP
ncbi:THUMP domain-containing protein [Hyphomicrobium sp. CS1BSMeth3]|uniref:THUMP domain-containing class I SAM-dependent RNA methyltransferase n=1 Tax=Hyphomicrobium sp. CS1BSMeth3 TaxID=1892844 RepID=UPI000931F712|nr:THUMP domain-containing protein [Hyphomicrobium sp. CS1BSMeth3]